MRKIQVLRIAGLIICTSPLVLKGQNISDLSKGLILGFGIGLLIISIIIQVKRSKTI